MNYSGGGFITSETGQSDGWYQQMAFSQTFQWVRWQVQILDQFSYLPEVQFGFGGGTGLGVPGIGGSLGPSVPSIGGSVQPGQNIYASIGPRYSNSFTPQVTYQTSRRGSITLGGSYGLLHFTENGNIDSDTYIGNVGYNYQLTTYDTIGLSYRFSAYHYTDEPQAIGDNAIYLNYGRKITKRLGLQIYGGPEITNYRVPVNNQKQTTAGSGGISFSYLFQNGSLSAGYFHGLSAGSGVLVGSTVDQVTVSGSRRLTRLWTIQGNLGFAKNRPLSAQIGSLGSDYDSVYVGGGVNRPFGKTVNFGVAYTALIQRANSTGCSGSACATSYTQNAVTLSLQWHSQPFVLR